MGKFFLLYRCDGADTLNALIKLGQYYEECGQVDKMLKCNALAAISATSKIESIITQRLTGYEYFSIGDLLLQCARYNDIVQWGNNNSIWQLYCSFAGSALENGNYDFARMLAKRLEKYDFDAVFESVDDLDAVINKAIRTGCFIPIVSEDYESVRFNEILGARKAHINRILEEQRNTSSYSRHMPPIISILTFDAFSETTPCEKTIDELWDEPCVEIFGNELPTQCDMAMRFILGRFFSWGTLYAFAKNFETDD